MLKYILFILLVGSVFLNYMLYNEGVRMEMEYNKNLTELWNRLNEVEKLNENLTGEINFLKERVSLLESKKVLLDFPEGDLLEDFIISFSKIKPEDKFLRFYIYSSFVYNNITYITEREDFWKHPMKTFWDKEGDCDDRTILLCYLLRKYFKTYIASCEDHAFCVVEYNCSEFNKMINESMKRQGYYIPEPYNCYSGNYKIIYVENGIIKSKTRFLEFISPEKGRCEVKELFDFESFGIPRNASLNLKNVFYPNISFNVLYSCRDSRCFGEIKLKNTGYYGIYVEILGEGFRKEVLLGGNDIERVNFDVDGNWLEVKTVLGSQRVNLE